MQRTIADTIATSQYKGVRKRRVKKTKEEFWEAYGTRNGKIWSKRCATEREAAIAYDLNRIDLGKEPKNILKRK